MEGGHSSVYDVSESIWLHQCRTNASNRVKWHMRGQSIATFMKWSSCTRENRAPAFSAAIRYGLQYEIMTWRMYEHAGDGEIASTSKRRSHRSGESRVTS
jgi:hypothetical protein